MLAEAIISRPEIDFSKPFFPSHLMAMAHVPSWNMLDSHHQIRYSQLFALYLNEQTVFFEELLATNLLPALYRRPDRIGEDLVFDLKRFEIEERQHSQWFRKLNHQVDPKRFGLDEGHYFFIPVHEKVRHASEWFARRPFAFPCWLWLMLLQEERSIAISKECLRKEHDMEPTFRRLHQKHLADEVDHVSWDIKLIERVWKPMPQCKRRLNARLLGMMMAEFFTTPKRSGKVVFQTWLNEFPEISSLGPQLHRELQTFSATPEYHASVYSRMITPKCFALFDELVEFRDINRYLLAYKRP